jgi:hypothetical protein
LYTCRNSKAYRYRGCLVISLSTARVSPGVDIAKYLQLQLTFFMNFDENFEFDKA